MFENLHWQAIIMTIDVFFLLAIGACVPEWQELESDLMRGSVVYCDSRDACNKESGDIIVSQVCIIWLTVIHRLYLTLF